MGHFSRNKGKVGERELARELSRVLGVSARRGVQFCGGPDSPDVVTDIPGIHFECKRTERFRLYESLDQAVEDSGDSVPVVMHRPNKKPWVAIVRLDDLPRLATIIAQAVGPPAASELPLPFNDPRDGRFAPDLASRSEGNYNLYEIEHAPKSEPCQLPSTPNESEPISTLSPASP